MKVKFMCLFLFVGFVLGCILTNITKQQIIIPTAKAEVVGMDSFDLRHDYDFKRAVKRIIQDSCRAEEDGGIYCY